MQRHALAQRHENLAHRRGGCIVANNGARIPEKTLNELCEIIAAQHSLICDKWRAFYLVDSISFYC